MKKKIVEIACSNLNSVINANLAGASRIELFENFPEGGCTPSFGMIKKAKEISQIPIFVLIRPRAGGFVYTEEEIEIMLEDIRVCSELNVDGIVVGALTQDKNVDSEVCSQLLSQWDGSATFHRAFDLIQNKEQATSNIISLGFERILTSGGENSAVEGREQIFSLHQRFANKIIFMAGGGLSAENINSFSFLDEVHASCKTQIITDDLFGNYIVSDRTMIDSLVQKFNS